MVFAALPPVSFRNKDVSYQTATIGVNIKRDQSGLAMSRAPSYSMAARYTSSFSCPNPIQLPFDPDSDSDPDSDFASPTGFSRK
jgi:hypothetical protein